MKRGSVRFQLTAWYSVILAFTFAAVGAGVWLTMQDSIHDAVDKDLRSRVRVMRDYLEKEGWDGDSSGLVEELDEQAALAAGTKIRIAASDGRWIYQAEGTSNWGAPSTVASRLPPKGKTQTIVAAGQPFRIVTAPVKGGMVQIGIPIDVFYEMLDDFTWTALLASPVLLLLASAGGYWMSGRALRPVDHITRAAREIGAPNLSRRLPLRGVGDELDRLSTTLNEMFARIENAFERITQFTADASHELRTPVTIIRTTAELTRSKSRTQGEYEQALDRILAESLRTSLLIEDLLLLARADAGAGDFTREPMDLVQVVRDVCAEARVLAVAKDIEIVIDFPARCVINADDHSLRRLFLILLDNAIKHTQPGGAVRLSVTILDAEAVVEVRDTGVGIAAEDIPHIFERFYRASKDRSRKTGGAGLGLAIAKWITGRHGGEITVASVLGSGSAFRVRLPLVSPLLQNPSAE